MSGIIVTNVTGTVGLGTTDMIITLGSDQSRLLNMFPIHSCDVLCVDTKWIENVVIVYNASSLALTVSPMTTMKIDNITQSTFIGVTTTPDVNISLVVYDKRAYNHLMQPVSKNFLNVQSLQIGFSTDTTLFTPNKEKSYLEYVVSHRGSLCRPLTITSSMNTTYSSLQIIQIFCDNPAFVDSDRLDAGTQNMLFVVNKYYVNSTIFIRSSSAGEKLELLKSTTGDVTLFLNSLKTEFGDIDEEVNALLQELTREAFTTWFNTSSPSPSPSGAYSFNTSNIRTQGLLKNIRNVQSKYENQVITSSAYSEDLMTGYNQVYQMMAQFKVHNKYIDTNISLLKKSTQKQYVHMIVIFILLALGIGLTFVSILYKNVSSNISFILSCGLLGIGLAFALVGILQKRL